MDTLDRFLIREFSMFFLVILLCLSSLYLGVDFFSNLWGFKLPMSWVLTIYGHKLPGIVHQFVPVACLMATLLVVSSMSRQNEILALYSSGVGTLRLVSTFIAVVATVSTISFLIFDSLVPPLNKRLELLKKGLDPNREEAVLLHRGGFWYRSGQLIYKVGHFTPETNTIENLNVYLLSPNFQMLERIHAKTARYVGEDWTLDNGFIVSYPKQHNFPMAKSFETRLGVIPERPSDFRTLKVQEEMMRLRDLRKFIARNKSYGLDTTGQEVHYQERLALVFTPLVFILLGIPFALRPLKTQTMPKSIAFCFLVVFIYLLMFRMTLSIGKGGHIPPLVAGWAPNVIFLMIAGMLISRRE